MAGVILSILVEDFARFILRLWLLLDRSKKRTSDAGLRLDNTQHRWVDYSKSSSFDGFVTLSWFLLQALLQVSFTMYLRNQKKAKIIFMNKILDILHAF
ncbi:MAG: hypothetical protein ACJ708_05310 [Nitrososphaeraceae archaeon]|jgi:hypothetical protein